MQMSFPLIHWTFTKSFSRGLLSTVKSKQIPPHKSENKEKGQLLSTLHEFLFKDLEVIDPNSIQNHH